MGTNIKVGDLVTVDLGSFNTVSNTYRVYEKIGNKCFLSHPLLSDCFIVRSESELNNTIAVLKNPLEKCLTYLAENKKYLGHSAVADLEAITSYFLIRKEITLKQRTDISNMCGKVAVSILNNNLSLSTEIIQKNQILLDDYNRLLYNNFQKVIITPTLVKAKSERFAIYNLVGYVLAQLG